MLLKVFDFVRSCLWYIVDFIYQLIDSLVEIVKELNAFDIIDSLSNNTTFQAFYNGICTIAVTLFALFVIWKLVNKVLDPDDDNLTIKLIVSDSIKCGALIMLSTFLFVQVSSFSITLANYTANIFENNSNTTISNSMLGLFISYNADYKKSDEFEEKKTIPELINNGSFNNDELYLEKFVTEPKLIFSDDKDYKYDINWIMALLAGGFFLYSLFFASIMLGRRQIEFLFLFAISPIIFATSVCNKQRRGAVFEQITSLVLQSAVIMLIISLTIMVMQEINQTTFFENSVQDMIVKVLLYLGCATFVLTGSQTVNRFIGSNVSAASGREQLMSLMGFGRVATMGAITGGATAIGGGLLATGGAIKAGNVVKNATLSSVGATLGSYGASNSNGSQTRLQKISSAVGNRMFMAGQNGFNNVPSGTYGGNRVSDIMMQTGANSINSAIRTVLPRTGYNPAYYRQRGTKI